MQVEEAVAAKQARSKRALPIAAVCLLVAAVVGIVFLVHSWPFTRAEVIKALQDRSTRQVQIQSFRQTFFPPGAVAEGVKFLRHEHPDRPPVITMQKLIIRGSYLGLITQRIPVVQVVGMHLTVPPREPGPDGRTHQVIPLTQGKGRSFDIGTIVADAVVIEFMSNHPDKEPYRLEVQKLELNKVGDKGPFHFRTMLALAKPPGEVHCSGTFGPWNPEAPGSSALEGSYVLDGANLGVFKDLAGVLSSKGTFKGELDRISVDGVADIPAFHVGHSSHTIHLSNRFHAVVNGTDGDTSVEQEAAHFARTTVESEGAVAAKAGQKGKFVDLTMAVQDGRIDDLLRIFVRAPQPAMSGVVSLRAQVEVPPDPRPFLEKLRMDGDFGIGGGRFTKGVQQSALNHLSESAAGEKKEQQNQDSQTVLSNLKGHAVVRNGVAKLTNVSFSFPGALARMNGTYNLISEQVDLHGVLETEGKLSDASTGFKSLFLKVVNPFFKKKNGTKVKLIPFKITGTASQPDLALEFGQKR